jgi:multimeric flavodoxin WrbA
LGTLIGLVGSGRRQGDTWRYVSSVVQSLGGDVPLIDLASLDIHGYRYDTPSPDYIALMERLLSYDGWILATPVYWSMMSSFMHIFFERFQDLTTVRKDLGRGLAGKKVFVSAVFAGGHPASFEDPFRNICQYMKMDYQGCTFFYTGTKRTDWVEENAPKEEALRQNLKFFMQEKSLNRAQNPRATS